MLKQVIFSCIIEAKITNQLELHRNRHKECNRDGKDELNTEKKIEK